jgi:hypothetical protein
MGVYGIISAASVASVAFAGLASASSVHGVPLFEYETKRLEDIYIPPGHADLFAFDTTGPIVSSGDCKPQPGDYAWPSAATWDAFDEALDGALIRTVPLAAPCYEDWGVYDSKKCESILSNWTNPYLQ